MRRIPEKPEWAEDQLMHDIEIHLGWKDRIKTLLGFTINVEMYINVEHAPGRMEGTTDISIRRPLWWPRRNRLKYGIVNETDRTT